jgi:hypothetical protein
MSEAKKKKPEGYVFGRPTKYKPEFCKQMIDYFDVPAYTQSTDNQGKPLFTPNMFPTLERFAASHLKVTRSTLSLWASEKNEDGSPKKPDFSEAYSMCKDMQAANLQEGAMSGAYQASFAAKAATNIMDWRDKQEIEHSGSIGMAERLTRARDNAKRDS